MTAENKNKKLKCGLVMPMSSTDEYTAEHWVDVRNIVEETLQAEYDICMVSETEEAGVIHNNIVHGLYDSDVVVCDISSRNANVMFELGMRLAFDKPFVIIYDGQIQIPFDTINIEYVRYPKDLNYAKINEFKTKLLDKVKKTVEKSQKDKKYSILQEFGKFEIVKLPENAKDNNDINKVLNSLVEEVSHIRLELRRQDIMRSEARVGLGAVSFRTGVLINDLLEHSPTLNRMLERGYVDEAVDYLKHRIGTAAPSSYIERVVTEALAKRANKCD